MAAPATGNPPIGPKSEGRLTDPAADTLLADSGAVGRGGIYLAFIGMSAGAAAVVTIQRRNAANSDNVGAVLSYDVGPGFGMVRHHFILAPSERVRVVMGANLTGGAAANVTLMREQ